MRTPFILISTSLVLGSFALVVACSSSSTDTTSSSSSGATSSGNGSSSGSTPVTTTDCNTACKSKATQCQASDAQATEACSGLCSSATQGQLTCLNGKSCEELQSGSFDTICPKGSGGSSSGSSSGTSSGSSGGNKKALGDACTCAGVSAGSEGLCAGTSEECAGGLSCVYASGSNGKGKCYASSCCDKTSECDDDSTKLKSCSQGTCTRTGIGWYCGK